MWGQAVPIASAHYGSVTTTDKAMKKTILTLLAACVALVAFSACSIDEAEITEYPMICAAKLLNGECRANSTPLNRTTYKTFLSSQRAVAWMPGIALPPTRLDNCAIVDGNNWKCSYPDGSGEVGFSNGIFQTKATSTSLPVDDSIFYVSGLRWWWHFLVASRI